MSSFTSILSALIIGLMPTLAIAADASQTLTDAQKSAVEDVVRNLLTKKEPDIIIKAAQAVQERQTVENTEKAQKAMVSNNDKIFNDTNSPVGGNPKGDVAVVEFYDYQCGYCKVAEETIVKLMGEDKNVKLIYKEFPILGPNSMQASKASLASVRQGKFHKFHEALMKTKDPLTDDNIFKIAKNVGLDIDKLKKDMADKAIETMIKDNVALGNSVGAHGTPTFIIGDQLFPGALPLENIKKAVEEARKAAKK